MVKCNLFYGRVKHALKNYLVNPNGLDLGFAMAALAQKTNAHYRELGGNLKKEAVSLSKTFAIDLKIGKWPDVLEGKLEFYRSSLWAKGKLKITGKLDVDGDISSARNIASDGQIEAYGWVKGSGFTTPRSI